MKIILKLNLVVCLLFILFSCKKSYTCECTEYLPYQIAPYVWRDTVNPQILTYKYQAKKNDAESKCKAYNINDKSKLGYPQYAYSFFDTVSLQLVNVSFNGSYGIVDCHLK